MALNQIDIDKLNLEMVKAKAKKEGVILNTTQEVIDWMFYKVLKK